MLGLWTLAILALVATMNRGLAVVAVLWGVVLPALGLPQATIMMGSMHWVIRVVHLLMGVIALGIADKLGKTIIGARSSGAAPQGSRVLPAR